MDPSQHQSTCKVHGTPTRPPGDLPLDDIESEPLDPLPPPIPPLPPMKKVSHHWHLCPELHKAIAGVRFIADHTKTAVNDTKVKPLEVEVLSMTRPKCFSRERKKERDRDVIREMLF
jgi:hypothetical protein